MHTRWSEDNLFYFSLSLDVSAVESIYPYFSLSLSLSRYIPTLYLLHEKKENKNFDPAHTIILIARK